MPKNTNHSNVNEKSIYPRLPLYIPLCQDLKSRPQRKRVREPCPLLHRLGLLATFVERGNLFRQDLMEECGLHYRQSSSNLFCSSGLAEPQEVDHTPRETAGHEFLNPLQMFLEARWRILRLRSHVTYQVVFESFTVTCRKSRRVVAHVGRE